MYTMLKFFLFFILSTYTHISNAKPSSKSCCINHKDKPNYPVEISKYDCSQLNSFGNYRCNSVYGGNVCKWVSGNSLSLIHI